LGSQSIIYEWRTEIIGYLEEMYGFREMDQPLEILRKLSAFSARASYMRNITIRSNNKEASAFRLEEVDPFLREAEFQFKVWSRVAAIGTQEWEMSRS
jgi:hypothetical protein